MADNVYSLFSGKKVKNLLQKSELADKLVNESGVYVGSLPKYEAELIRSLIDQMGRKKGQIDGHIHEFNAIYERYTYTLADTLIALGVEPAQFDPKVHRFYVDERGHGWIVPRKEEPDN